MTILPYEPQNVTVLAPAVTNWTRRFYVSIIGPSAGNAGYLVALTAFLSKAYGYKVRSECLFETNGNSYGLDIAAQVLTAPGDAALVVGDPHPSRSPP